MPSRESIATSVAPTRTWLLSALVAVCIACALPGHAALQTNPAPTDYTSAKAIADADEASLDAAAKAAMLKQLRTFLDAGIAACATGQTNEDLGDFVVVMRLDADGRVGRTWSQGSTPLALCVERNARGKVAFVPPRAPFHSSLEVSFVP